MTDLPDASSPPPPRTPTFLLVAWLLFTMLWWWLAFVPQDDSVPRWLLALQEACFGGNVGGGPAPYGWVGLVVVPAFWVVAMGVMWGREILAVIRQALQSKKGTVVLLALLVPALAEAVWVKNRIVEQQSQSATVAKWGLGRNLPAELPEFYPLQQAPLPPFEFVDQTGATVTPASLAGTKSILVFTFGQCTTICPLVVKTAQLAISRATTPVRVVVVTLDPWRDTPDTLPQLVQKWELAPGDLVLTGSVEALNGWLDEMKIRRSRDPLSGDIDHLALIYLLDDEGRLAYTFSSPSVGWLEQALQRME